MTRLKKWRLPICSQRQAGLLIVGFLVFFFLGVGGVNAQQYTEVFSDDFDRADTASSGVGSGWQDPNMSWKILNNTAIGNGIGNPLVRPENIINGKVELTTKPTLNNSSVYAILARYNSTTGAGYVARSLWFDGTLHTIVSKLTQASDSINGTRLPGGTFPVILYPSGPLRMEFSVESLSLTTTELTVVIYSGDDEVVTYKVQDSTAGLQKADIDTMHSQYGLFSYNNNSVDATKVFSSDESFNVYLDKQNIPFGKSVEISLSSLSDQKISFTDNGFGGNFSSESVGLDSSNSYTTTVNYTPSSAGMNTITLTDSNDGSYDFDIFVWPYSTTIGFIGDSITSAGYGVGSTIEALGFGFESVNVGVSGTSTNVWLGGSANLTNAITAFQSAGVEVVHIMHGANDAAQSVSAETYKSNLANIIEALQTAGFKKVILSQPIGTTVNGGYLSDSASATQNALMEGYANAILELVDDEQVLLGDTQAYNYFMSHTNLITDAYHPSSVGYTQLGQFWAEAIKSNLEYQISPDHSFTGGNSYTKGTTGNLTFQVDKWIGEFSGVVVSGMVLTSGMDYTLTEGSTIITLEDDYLDTLPTGNHTLTASFSGGVQVSDTFTIDDPTPPTPPTPPTTPTVPTSSGGGGGGTSLKADSCPAGDLSPSYYDGTCGTTADLAPLVEAKVNLLKRLIRLIYLTSTEKEKTLVHNIITSCSQTNKKEVIKLACQDLVKNWEF